MELEYTMTAEVVQAIRTAVAEVFAIESVITGKNADAALRFHGHFMIPPDEAYRVLAPRLKALGFVVLFRSEQNREAIWILPGNLPTDVRPSIINAILLGLTILSTIFSGVLNLTGDPMEMIRRPWLGLPFALSLMVILVAHELGHYVAGRQFGVPVSLPYFIPMPYSPFGTLGAVISMKAPPPNRRALLAVAAAGPLSGLFMALPILLLGLHMSAITPLMTDGNVIMEGNSILYYGFKFLMFGRALPGGGLDVYLHPVALAGWAGLLVTGLNLLPVGQLDGGHIMYALLGEKARLLTWPVIAILAVLGMAWNGWFLVVVLLLFFGRVYAAPLDDLTRLTPNQRLVGWLVVLIFVLVFTPLPLTVY